MTADEFDAWMKARGVVGRSIWRPAQLDMKDAPRLARILSKLGLCSRRGEREDTPGASPGRTHQAPECPADLRMRRASPSICQCRSRRATRCSTSRAGWSPPPMHEHGRDTVYRRLRRRGIGMDRWRAGWTSASMRACCRPALHPVAASVITDPATGPGKTYHAWWWWRTRLPGCRTAGGGCGRGRAGRRGTSGRVVVSGHPVAAGAGHARLENRADEGRKPARSAVCWQRLASARWVWLVRVAIGPVGSGARSAEANGARWTDAEIGLLQQAMQEVDWKCRV